MFDITFLPQVAAAKGDYTVSKRRQSLSFEYAYAILLGMQQAAITWVRSCFHMASDAEMQSFILHER